MKILFQLSAKIIIDLKNFNIILCFYSTNGNDKSTTKDSSKKVSAQCSSSTDEGCETDVGGTSDTKG